MTNLLPIYPVYKTPTTKVNKLQEFIMNHRIQFITYYEHNHIKKGVEKWIETEVKIKQNYTSIQSLIEHEITLKRELISLKLTELHQTDMMKKMLDIFKCISVLIFVTFVTFLKPSTSLNDNIFTSNKGDFIDLVCKVSVILINLACYFCNHLGSLISFCIFKVL